MLVQIASLYFSFSEQHGYPSSESQEYTATPPRCEISPLYPLLNLKATVDDMSKTTALAQACHASYTAKVHPQKHAATG